MKKKIRMIAFVLVLTLLTGTMPTELFSFEVIAAQSGYTDNAPFIAESAHNSYFASPALLTRGDGALLAAADALWDESKKNGADTVTSISSDGGAVWKWHYANYLGDNGDANNDNSTKFCDPALAIRDNTVYMLVTLYPGLKIDTTNSSNSETYTAGSGFDADGRLLLTDADGTEYYLSDGKIYDANNAAVEGYTVDENFDLYQNGTHVSNLFFTTSPYRVTKTAFLYLTTSADGGKSWSAPTLLNVKENNETECAPASGRGVVMKDGSIVFPVVFGGKLGFVHIDTTGKTTRVDSTIEASSAAVVKIGDTLRFFYNNGANMYYADCVGSDFGEPVDTGVVCTGTSRISAVPYTQQVNGKDALCVSHNGQITAFSVDENNKLTQLHTCTVTGGTFNDSCLTTMADGRMALLYESAEGTITFTRVEPEQLFGADAVIGNVPYLADDTGRRVTAVSLVVKKGAESVTVKNPNGEDVKDVTSDNPNVVKAAYDGGKLTLTPVGIGSATVSLTVGGTVLAVQVTVSEYATENITLTVGETVTFTFEGSPEYTAPPDKTVVSMAVTRTDTLEKYEQEPLPDGEYCICTSQNNNCWPLTATPTENGTRLVIDGAGVSSDSARWKFEKQTNGYYYISRDGMYLNVGLNNNDHVTVSQNPQELIVKMDDGKWYIRSATVTRYLNQWGGANEKQAGAWNDLDDGSHWYLYRCVGTQVTFAGVSEGTRTAIVGYTTFNIKVKLPEKYLVTTVGKTVKIRYDGTMSSLLTSEFVTITNQDGMLCFEGKQATGKTPQEAVIDGVRYCVTVLAREPEALTTDTTPIRGTDGQAADSPVTALGIGTGEASAYTLRVETGSEVHWCSSDESIVTVDENGTVTGVYDGDEPYAEATVTALIDGVPYSIPVTVWKVNNDTETKKTIDVYNYETVHATAYYSFLAHGVHDCPEGTLVHIVMDSMHAYALNFFGVPEDGYVVTQCGQTGSAGEFSPFGEGATGTTNKTIYAATSGWGNDQGVEQENVQSMLDIAGKMGAQAAFYNTRGSNVSDELEAKNSIIAEKLATVEKTLTGVLRKSSGTYRSYAGARMTAEVGDYVYFTITVTQEAPTAWSNENTANGDKHGLLIYAGAKLQDIFTKGEGACSFYTAAEDANHDGWIDDGELTEKDITADLNAAWTKAQIEAGKRELVYYVVYKVVEADLALQTDESGKILEQIVNTVDLSYSYTSKFSKQTGDQKANAKASVLVVGKYVGQYVVDFGLPLQIEITGDDSGFQYVNTEAEKWYESTYGVLDLDSDTENHKYTLTYTPTTILNTSDEVLIYRQEDGKTVVNSLTIVPATTVYYEESFLTSDKNWKSGGTKKNDLYQDADILGDKKDGTPVKMHPYGYDAAYKGEFTASGGTWLEADIEKQDSETDFAEGPTASFTFTGTGFELYALCAGDTGTVQVQITPKVDGKIGTYSVNTKASKGESDATSGQEGDFGALPIVSVTELPWGTYTVTLKKLRADGAVKIDGVRIHGTVREAAGTGSAYYNDREDHPEYFELRDYVLNAMGVGSLTAEEKSTIADQVYNDELSAIVFDAGNPYGADVRSDLLWNGPKNELFLWNGQSVTFKVKTNRLMQLGMKAPQGQTTAEITLGDQSTKSVTVDSAVDMFYELNDAAKDTTWLVTVKNTGDKVLSLTKLKICDDPEAAIVPLSGEDVTDTLIGLRILSESDRAEAMTQVVLTDHTGAQIASATLRRAGVAGMGVTFRAQALLEAARGALPQGYAIVNEAVVTDVETACGSSRVVTVQVGQVATVEVTYISLRTRRVCTVTLTKVQFSEGECRISAAELMRHSPLGRELLSTRACTVPYGQTTAVTVFVL